MAKQKKKKKHSTAPVEPSSTGALKAQLKQFNWKRLVFIVVSTLAAFSLYEAMIILPYFRIGGIPVIMPIYFTIVTVLICAVIILNSGFSKKSVTPDMLRSDGNEDEAQLTLICEKLNLRKEKAKRLMLILLPFLFSIFFDMIYLFYGDFFRGAIEAIFGL